MSHEVRLVAFVIIAFCVAVHRVLLVTLPFFRESLLTAPVVNLACGIASDVSFLALVFAGAASARGGNRFAKWASLLCAWLFAMATATHIRYVEHFGMTFKPYHAIALSTGEVWGAGTWMVLQSWRAWVVLVGAAGVWVAATRAQIRNAERTPPPRARRVVISLATAVALNSLVINLRYQPNTHAELRYNMLSAAFYGYRDYAEVMATPKPSPAEMVRLRELLAGERHYAGGDYGRDFPLWQTMIPSSSADGPSGELRGSLRGFITAEEKRLGPWNVVLVLSESLRAKELSLWGGLGPDTPGLSTIAAEGIRFTETMSAGFRTHFGQTAAGCSLYGAEDFTILAQAPMTNAACLGDVFAKVGYENHFFYGADNHFDNQDIFYSFHRMKQVHGQHLMPKSGAKGGWGYSDHAVFEYTLEQLENAASPFFATVLTLSNHAPWVVPQDVESGVIDKNLPVHLQLVQYVDWSTGVFYRKLREKFPHTIFVLIADHGRFHDETLGSSQPPLKLLRDVTRIPWVIAIPGMPQEIRGQTVGRLTSNADVPPTLLSILGRLETPNQFMGEDAFSRRGPVYIDFQNDLLALSERDGKVELRHVSTDLERFLGAAGRFNLLAPPRDERDAPLPM